MENLRLIFKNNGVYEWIIVRLSAIIIAFYCITLCSFIALTKNLSYTQWYTFFNSNVIKIFNFIILLLVLAHTWIGLRHILEDYIKSITLRRFVIGLASMILYIYFLLGTIIIWRI